ncbi:MAG: hypothetical protein KM310_00155 [Clostridiales bacterium]|nr:hypothetical protein [Clostridiales bacterium]
MRKRVAILGLLLLLVSLSGCGGPKRLGYEFTEAGLGAEVKTQGTVEITEEKGRLAGVRGEFKRRLYWDGRVFEGKGVWEREAGGEMSDEGARLLERIRGWERWTDPKGRPLGEAEWDYQGIMLASKEGAGNRGLVSLRWVGPSGDSWWIGGSVSNLVTEEKKTVVAVVWESLDWMGKYLLATVIGEKDQDEGHVGLVWGYPLEEGEEDRSFEVQGNYRGPDLPYYLLSAPLPVWLFVELGVDSR